jgi:hypothetical protein
MLNIVAVDTKSDYFNVIKSKIDDTIQNAQKLKEGFKERLQKDKEALKYLYPYQSNY